VFENPSLRIEVLQVSPLWISFPRIKHGILIPSFNSGPVLVTTVRRILPLRIPVTVVIDGSTDGSAEALRSAGFENDPVTVLTIERNRGKGAAVLQGMQWMMERGFTHAVVFDSDGQHEVADLPRMIELSQVHPDAMILGVPHFGKDAPAERVHGRKLGNLWARINSGFADIGDSLFGFRVYPIQQAVRILTSIRTARRFEFDTEIVVRMAWEGIPAVNIRTRVYYPSREEGGVSHFNYWRDNLLLIRAHLRLFFGMIWRLPRLLAHRRHPRSASSAA
jgi:glycosyltransferase involved in cell wall biosynthesis